MGSADKGRSKGIIAVAVFAIVAGLGEIVVGVRGNYLGILSTAIAPSATTAVVGAFYSLGGVSLLVTRRRWGAVLGITFIGLEILGRIYLVAAGIAPSHGSDAVKIAIGAAIALALMLYVLSKWKSFA